MIKHIFLDYDDLTILKEFRKLKEGESTTTWKIMKNIYQGGKERENNRVNRKIKKMSSYGFFYVQGNDPALYTLIKDIVKIKKFVINNKTYDGIALMINGKWQIFEI